MSEPKLYHFAVLCSGRFISSAEVVKDIRFSLLTTLSPPDVTHFVSKITRHKALLGHFFESFSPCTLSLIPVLLGHSHLNFRLLSITPCCEDLGDASEMGFLGHSRDLLSVWRGQSHPSLCPGRPRLCVCVSVWNAISAHLQHQSVPAVYSQLR